MPLNMDEEILQINDKLTSRLPEPYSLIVKLVFSAILITIFLAATFGNIATLLVINRNYAMQTTTFIYLYSQSICYIFILSGLPLELTKLWNPLSYPLGDKLCVVVELISQGCIVVNGLIITALTFEIKKKVMSQELYKTNRTVTCNIMIWVCALFFAVPLSVQYSVHVVEKTGQMVNTCTVKEDGLYQFIAISNFVLYVVPTSLVLLMYMLFIVKLKISRVWSRRSGEPRLPNDTPEFRSSASQRTDVKMLVAVALSIFVCWAPYHVQRLLPIYGKNLEISTDTLHKIDEILTLLSGVLYYLAPAIIPVLYIIISNEFRKEFKVLLTSWFTHQDRSGLERTDGTSRSELGTESPLQRSPHPRCTCADPIQPYQAAPQAQSLNQSNLFVVNEESELRRSRHRLAEGKDHHRRNSSPHSISNSNPRATDQELNSQELATFSGDINFTIVVKKALQTSV